MRAEVTEGLLADIFPTCPRGSQDPSERVKGQRLPQPHAFMLLHHHRPLPFQGTGRTEGEPARRRQAPSQIWQLPHKAGGKEAGRRQQALGAQRPWACPRPDSWEMYTQGQRGGVHTCQNMHMGPAEQCPRTPDASQPHALSHADPLGRTQQQ